MNTQPPAQQKKKAYKKPELVIYGSLEKLTRGVTGSVVDSGLNSGAHLCPPENPVCSGNGVPGFRTPGG